MVPMNLAVSNSFGAELSRIGTALKESAVWPSPATGLAVQLLSICDCQEQIANLLGFTPFPDGPLDTAPAAATAGFSMAVIDPQTEQLSRWREGLMRLMKCEPFPRDRQTFAYRPTELVGLAVGITKTEGRTSAHASWIRKIIQNLPAKSPPSSPWSLLLYHYAASIVGIQFPFSLPAQNSNYDTSELGLMVALLEQGNVFNISELVSLATQDALLKRVLTLSPQARETERLAALYAGLSLSLKRHISAFAPSIENHITNTIVHQTSSTTFMKQKILFLAANPTGVTQLALDEECRQITKKVRAADHRDSLELITRWAVRPEDLLQHLNEHRPHVVHFSGHGTITEEIVLLDKERNPVTVPAPALKQLFTTLKDNIRVVVLNACFSKPQAVAITEVIDCAIGMNKAIGDDAAIAFAAAFYQAIGFGRSVKVAFDSGKTALMLAGIPEEKTPELLCRTGVDPAAIVLVEPNPAQRPPK